MKNFIYHDFPKLERVDGPDGRVYNTPSGKRYPSITRVTGMLTEQAIKEWRGRVGHEEANKISTKASNRGTRIHTLCEDFLKSKPVEPDMFDVELWNSIKSYVDKIDNIHALESKLYSDKLQVAGTVDCIGEYEGVLNIIDFKTSGKQKDINNIQHYFLQATAYSVMFEELTGITVPDITILIGVDHDKPQVFQQKRSSFIQRLVDTRQSFKKIYLL
mgnify:CR=1 FL=1